VQHLNAFLYNTGGDFRVETLNLVTMITSLRHHGRNLICAFTLGVIATGVNAQAVEVALNNPGQEVIASVPTTYHSASHVLISQELIYPKAALGIDSPATALPAYDSIWQGLMAEKWLLLIALTLLISVVLNVVQFLRIVKLTHSSL
jgi:hypothetical protein